MRGVQAAGWQVVRDATSVLATDVLQQTTDKGFEYSYEYCFPAGTLVRMDDGTWKPIEQVQVGDKVLSVPYSAALMKHLSRASRISSLRTAVRTSVPTLIEGAHRLGPSALALLALSLPLLLGSTGAS